MTHWDGLSSSNSSGEPQRICILGATNRIQDIDEAILRRMPKKFPVSLPSAHQRRGIFKLILRETKIDRTNFDLDYLVKISAGMSGSDIKEACRDAAMCPVREYINIMKKEGRLRQGVNPEEVRGVRTEDFFGKGSGLAFEELGARAKQDRRRSQADEIDVDSDPEFETESDTQSGDEEVEPVYKDANVKA
jgi:SpoVK/Ycf46/Vps4 family AAA+-type ATPase